jgi:hypothetical protein
MRYRQIITEAPWKYSSFAYRSWYNPATKEFKKVPLGGGNTHATMVRDHPEIFGIDPEAISKLEYSSKNEQPFKNLALDNGWIRVAAQDRQNPNKLILLEGKDMRQIQRLAKMFWLDMGGEIGSMLIKCDGKEWRLQNNNSVKAFTMRAELPSEHFTSVD